MSLCKIVELNLGSKIKQIPSYVQKLPVKINREIYNTLNIKWILKLVYEDKTPHNEIKKDALERPARYLISIPSVAVSAFAFLFALIVYAPSIFYNEYVVFAFLGVIFYPIIFTLAPIRYFLSPTTISARVFFDVNGTMKTVVEFRWVSKVLMASIPIMIIFAMMALVLGSYDVQLSENDSLYLRTIFLVITLASAIISLSAIWKFLMLLIYTDYRYYLAKSSLELSLHLENEFEKINYLYFGINSYNKYLRRVMKLQIQKTDEVVSQIISNSNGSMNDNIQEIYDSFDLNNVELIQILKKKYPTNDSKDDVLTGISFKDKVIEWSPLIGIIISVSVSLPQIASIIITLYPELFEQIQP
ncbi:hypothetical protein C5F47_05270 [Nitrosopumilus cobalaminigenes]|uniref:Uncharacterized protein n=1 Tax=Nitrosopumilus cobalaminigenes TaxID=1470066 RepID=A0A7D5R2J4_9ARCH|nr:hypothetical protein [Nitrosopumilus cobalaminigenes]QLH02999.1 hypothetical protein C5F47_05270 [Nitrosopumilus cobalaminigenes]